MARYCGSCGAEVEEDAKVCGNCGVPLDGGPAPKVELKVPTKVDSAAIKKIAIIAAAVLVVVVIGVVALKIIRANTGYRAMLNRTFKAIQKADAESFMNELSLYIEDSYGSSSQLEKTLDNEINSYLDMVEDEVGPEPKFTYEIKKTTKLSDRKLKNLRDSLEDSDKDYEGDSLKKAMKIDLNVKIKGPDDDYSDSVENMLIVKEGGEWKILSFSDFGMYYSY